MIDFWFSIGSTYTYLSVMRLAEVAAETGIEFRWLPFNVRAIMIEMDNIPFAKKPAKAAYMWRDIERRAAMYRMVPKLPAPYPLAELERANRVALIAAREGWCEAYARETYRRWFEMGEPAGSEPNISASIEKAGQKAEPVLRRADSDDAKAELAAATEQAKALGVFGSPSFVVDGELFWGDDRLEDAMRWLKRMESGPPD
ncbi:2-hydroxychromene-2-carboxylate isomerase [Mesorhizobium sp. M1A.F.Ca.IN.020.06.1.1]|uniref:2-hydroxychromene-2-carboxylate isomerase n=6 Tax=Mesorhizobium TaxID=68287 RepID=UPI000BB01716|nr:MULTISPECIES: 2-hydroxychromene-2-carboxylate isomerase [unclassified Mesorhizobium]PBB34046.1 2-hydroxychromene-2-carboxylate isomerase [Mesorhizobium sp. WSM3882]RUV00389.1 2-hydroxychromene-2-carboxylate isomerase [Mesorhizobium sp. M1A.F.Ca.IN.020.03.2.1]RUV89312.1 2-hydroxychromene-2-carboxylate isomerase [Mesorhizobium sp. M1A.F.Ca.IN.020.32.1.1]RUW21156.1 2-hydroxychromene-2-carboxylate isomerase [Mesorhizobium sp. M1A.F.Ca.IN.020.06.1.1]RWG02510.1 MAG: 2-hydroxychromene-2-carboxylat